MKRTLLLLSVFVLSFGLVAADDNTEPATGVALEAPVSDQTETCEPEPVRIDEMKVGELEEWADSRGLTVSPVGGGAAEECPRIHKCGPGCSLDPINTGCHLTQDTGLTACRLEGSVFSCKGGQTVHVRECGPCGPPTQICYRYRVDLVCN